MKIISDDEICYFTFINSEQFYDQFLPVRYCHMLEDFPSEKNEVIIPTPKH